MNDIISDQQDYSTPVAAMLLPGFGWTGIDFWTFIAPTIIIASFNCKVIDIEIIDIQENGTPIPASDPSPVTVSGMVGDDYLMSVDIAKCESVITFNI